MAEQKDQKKGNGKKKQVKKALVKKPKAKKKAITTVKPRAITYSKKKHLPAVEVLLLSGWSLQRVAGRLGLTRKQFTKWRVDHPEFDDMIVESTVMLKGMINRAQLKRALGEYQEFSTERKVEYEVKSGIRGKGRLKIVGETHTEKIKTPGPCIKAAEFLVAQIEKQEEESKKAIEKGREVTKYVNVLEIGEKPKE